MLRAKLQNFIKVKTNSRVSKRLRCLVIGNETTITERNEHERRRELQFNDSRLATETKSFSDIVRALVILKLCTIETLVDNSEKLVAWCKGIFGTQFYEKIIKATIYKQFVAGETEQDVKYIASELQKSNINCMFCIPTEDVSSDNLLMKIHDVEALYEINLNLMSECVDLTASLGCYAQSKLTPLVSSDVMHDVADLLSDHITSHEGRPSHLSVPFWSNALGGEYEGKLIPEFSNSSNRHLKKAFKRWDILASRAQEKGVRLMLDAEYTNLQASIDLIILALQHKYNRRTPFVYNTYQCYRKDTPARLQSDIELAQKHNFKIACKLVRGAYMEYERQRAAEYGYEDPICDTIEETERNYKHAMDLMLSQVAKGQAEVMFATHNEDCVEYGIKRMQEIGIKPDDGSVSFAQLYGMCDHVSYALGSAGYIVHKSVPYGTVDNSILYLLRRAQENKSVIARTAKESGLLHNEMKRRMWTTIGYA